MSGVLNLSSPKRQTAQQPPASAPPARLDVQPQAQAKPQPERNSGSKASRGDEASEPISVKLTVVKLGKLTPNDAESMAETSQDYAASILNCIATTRGEDNGDFCIGVYGADVVRIRDKLHNRGIEIAELNLAAHQLETGPSIAVLRSAASVLRAVADRLPLMARQANSEPIGQSKTKASRIPGNESNPPTTQKDQSEPTGTQEKLKPVLVGHETGKVKWFMGGAGHGFIDGESGHEVYVDKSAIIEPGYHFLEDGASVEYDLMRTETGFQASNVKLIQAGRATHANVQKEEPIPGDISITLPEKIGSSKSYLEILSTHAGRESTDLKVCLVDRGDSGEAARFCNRMHATSISNIRTALRNAGVLIEPLQDVVRRMERGATAEELRYAARVMDLLSQELGKRAK